MIIVVLSILTVLCVLYYVASEYRDDVCVCVHGAVYDYTTIVPNYSNVFTINTVDRLLKTDEFYLHTSGQLLVDSVANVCFCTRVCVCFCVWVLVHGG